MADRLRHFSELPPDEQRLCLALIEGRRSAAREALRERGEMADWERTKRRRYREIVARALERTD